MLIGTVMGSRDELPLPIGVRELCSSTAGDTARRLLLVGYGSNRSSTRNISQLFIEIYRCN
jgi:hypothetical protein